MSVDLDTYLPLKLGNLADRLSVTGREAYAAFDLGGGAVRMILVLDARPGSTAAELSRITQIDKAAVSRTLRELQDKGLTRTTQAGRRARIWLSEAGEGMNAALLPIAIARQAQLTEGVSEAELSVLLDVVRRMLANLGTTAED